MVSLDEAVIARLERGGERFEILVDPEGAKKLKEGDDVDVESLLAADAVFSDARKGERASESSLVKSFGTDEVGPISLEIIKRGELQLTLEQRKKMLEETKRRIVSIIAKNAINPQNHLPHPATRIERAMDEARVHIDPFKRVEDQVQDVLKALRPILPIRFETLTFRIKIPAKSAGRCYGKIRALGEIRNESWLSDGSWSGTIEIAAGMRSELFDLVQSASGGEAEVEQVT